MPGSVIVAGARTPIGKLSGALASFAATDLGGFAIRGALERAGVAPDQVDYVFMGQVLQAGAGQITARQAAVNAGIPMTVPATTINKVCLSGLNALHLADQAIQLGEADVVVAGGMESMTRSPYLVPGARAGLRMGDSALVDSMLLDGLFCAFDACAMGAGTEKYTRAAGTIDRARQDAFAATSHERASAAMKEGRFAEEIVPVSVPESYRAAVVLKDEVGMFEGIDSADKDPRKSLHVQDVAVPEMAPNEALVAVMASSINFNTVWTSIFEPLPTFDFLTRLGKESVWGKRHDLPYHVVGSDASGVIVRVGSAVRNWKPGDRVVVHCNYVDDQDPSSHDDSMLGANQRIWGFESTSAGWPTWRSSRRTSSCPSRPTSRGRRRRSTPSATRPPTACSWAATGRT